MTRRAWVETIMGMPVSVHVRGPRADASEVAVAVDALFDELRDVDAMFSTYRPDSAVSRYADGMLTGEVPPALREVVALCEQARLATDGLFDAHLPGIDGTRRFDPSGLVKGWAVERATRALDLPARHSVLVNAGGDVMARDVEARDEVVARDDGSTRAGNGERVSDGERGRDYERGRDCERGRDDRRGRECEPWRVGIEDPADRSRIVAVVPLRTGGVATSGTAARGDHLVDPRTGRTPRGLRSVSVTGPSLMWADVYATAAFVAGPAALDVLRGRDGYAGVVVDTAGTVTTCGFAPPAVLTTAGPTTG